MNRKICERGSNRHKYKTAYFNSKFFRFGLNMMRVMIMYVSTFKNKSKVITYLTVV